MRAVSKTFGLMALVLTGIIANAQNLHELKVNVPFAFTVAGKTLPAGDYHLLFNPMTAVVTVRGESSAAVFMTAPTDLSEDGRSFLRFYALGEKRILQDVSIQGSVRRVSSAHAKNTLLSGSFQSEPQMVGGSTTVSFVTVPAEGGKN